MTFQTSERFIKMTKQYGLVAIGNAIIDILSPTTEEFITSQIPYGMNRGAMSLISSQRAAELYNLMGPATEMSGGSAGNTMAVYASLGGTGAFIGKVADDEFGTVYRHDMRSIGIDFDTPPLKDGPPTAQCLILVTPDAQRTMNTFLGASTRIASDDVDESLIASSAITYLEGYLFDDPVAKAAFFKAATLVKKHGRRLALTLSDPFCVHRHREDFLKLIEDHVDILFANEEELKGLYDVLTVEDAFDRVRSSCSIAAITLGAKGSILISGNETISVAAIPPVQLVDTTGAGDAYAAGVLFGLSEGKSLAEAGRIGSFAASEVISHMGPRPARPLRDGLAKLAA
jgi:sugar/nucleoside kinase (ribokinase family)